tara:strand:- start:558 stop:788 length:231 start_codon:yes stop_codon:yes gene_type:complete
MELKYNEVLGEIVKPNDEAATQSEIMEWMLDNPGKPDASAKASPKMINDVLDSLTVKQTPDSTTVEEGVEIITNRG